jgi:ketosteroid isomerase-like protein
MDKVLWLTLLAAAPVPDPGSARGAAEGDRARILEHIHGIFRAYLARDRDEIRRMHTADWVGFQGPSTRIERGIEAYMRNAELSLEAFRGTGYELLDTEVQLYGDVALVYYVARYDCLDAEGRPKSIRLRAIDVYRKQDGEWNQCGSHITPVPTTGAWGEGAGAAEGGR